MNTNAAPSFARQLVDRLSFRLANEKRELVLFLIELADFDAKNLALELGHPSTLGCLMTELGLTESSACRRIAAARLLARFPQIAPYLMSSRLTLTALVALKDVLDEANVDELLERAAGRSEPEVRQLVMRVRLADAAPAPGNDVAPAQLALARHSQPVATAPAAAPAADRVATQALEPVTLWVGREFREELAAVRALVSHAVPSGKTDEVLLHVLKAQRKLLERKRYGSAKKQPTAAPSTRTNDRYIPAAVRREVYERDGGACTFVGEAGRRCGSTVRVEYQHIVPVAKGGRSTVSNLTLYCRAHNQLQAHKDFGEARCRAVSALANLGYARKDAEPAVRAALAQLSHEPDLPTLLTASLRILTP